jgi:putative membrane protein
VVASCECKGKELMMLASLMSENFGMSVLSASVFGLLGIILMMLGFKVFDWITPKIDIERELAEKHNIAVAIVVAAVFLGISVILACVLMA